MRSWIASSLWSRADRFAHVQRVILDGLAAGHLKPVISRTFPFDEIVEAHRYLESNQQLGKIVVTVG